MPDGARTDGELLSAILAEVLALRREVAALRRPADARLGGLLDAIDEFYADAEFTVAELLADAELEAEAERPELRRALAQAGVRLGDPQAPALAGVRLRDLPGLVRVRTNRRGATVWRVTDIPSATLGTDDE